MADERQLPERDERDEEPEVETHGAPSPPPQDEPPARRLPQPMTF